MARQKMVTGPGIFSVWQPRTDQSRAAQSAKSKAVAATPVGRVALAARITHAQAAKAIAAINPSSSGSYIIMIKAEDITLFNDIRERLLCITEEQIAATARRLKKDVKIDNPLSVIGTIESASTRGLYALTAHLEAESRMLTAKSRMATDEASEAEHQQQAVLLDMISDVAREMFWTQARIDLGFYEPVPVDIRFGWRLVRAPEEHDLPNAILARLSR